MASSFTNYTNVFVEKNSYYDDYDSRTIYSLVAVIATIVYFSISSVFSVKKKRKDTAAYAENNTRGLYGQPAILGIGTANPPHNAPIDRLEEFLESLRRKGANDEQIEFSRKISNRCGIQCRYTGISPEQHFNGEGLFGQTLNETCERRNEYWMEFAKKTAIEASKKAIENWGGDKKRITHVIFHSCTGFKAPGIELDVVDELNLTGVKRRLGINFMGCFGGFTALNVAKSFCLSDPGSVALIVCAESCTAHMCVTEDKSEMLGSVIFADGAAACIVGPGQYGDWCLGNTLTKTLGKETRSMMTWFPSDLNYRMYLSKEIGNQFGVGLLVTVRSLIKGVLGEASMSNAEWCVHPGGKGLLDGLAKGIGEEKLRHSYNTLKNYGNMSSPTIFFVIKHMLDENKGSEKKDAICLGFEPG
jgi:predicted naringenin-chalcone synthase